MKQSTRATWPIFVVAIVTALVFAPLCGHDFTWWDDFATIHQNPAMNPPTWAGFAHYWSSFAYGLYAPVTYTVWLGLARIARLDQPDAQGIGLNPWVFHSASVLVHVTAAVFAFLLLRRLTQRNVPAMLGALLFALHPLQVESVGWVSGMKDVLAGCFGMIALWRYVVRMERDDDDGSIMPDPWGTIALVLALLSKSSAMMVPLVGIAIARFVMRRDWRTSIRSMSVWIVLAIPIAVVARLAQGTLGLEPAPLWARPFIAGDSIAFYICKFIWPAKLGVDYGRTPAFAMQTATFYIAWLLPVSLAMLAWFARRGAPWIAGALLVFVIPILPVSGLTTFLFQFTSTVADHYVYLALLGPAIALAMFVGRFDDRPIVPLIAGAMLFLLAGRSFVQTIAWTNDRTLFENALGVNPRSHVAHNNLGHDYWLKRDYPAAEREFREAIDDRPDYSDAWDNLAAALLAQGDVEGAIAAKEKMIELRAKLPPSLFPNYMESHNELGQMLLERGEIDRAIAHFEALLKLKPEHAEARKFLEAARARKAATTAPTTTSN